MLGPFPIFLMLVLLLSGCGLFSTRDAEPPDTGRHSWETPREPQAVLDNMRTALFDRDAVNYLLSFDPENFSFEADNEALANDPSLSPWRYEDESGHINTLLSEGTLPPANRLVLLFPTSEETLFQDSAEIVASYELTAEVAISGAPQYMEGTARFHLRLGNEGYWQIYRWTDIRTEEQNTWSDLRSVVR